MKEIEVFVQAAKEAALIGGIVLKENFRKVKNESIEEKAEKDFVSYVDKTSEERIRDYLSRRFTEHRIVGEEEGGDEEGEFVWYIDPLDGTKNYIAGFPIFGVSVGLTYRKEPIAGAVYLPAFNSMYWAGKDMGAFKDGKTIRVSNTSDVKFSVVAYGFPSRAKRELDTYWLIFKEVFDKVAAMRRPGAAAVDLCFVAEGIFEGLIEFELHPWDITAGIVILKEAGGNYKMLEKGLKRDIIASNGKIQNFLEGIVSKHIKEA
ncbi:myo-inositol-1(or 4)-monophosphatase [Hydrogenivirga caldilitoris]|uniref:Inositol-1-monophosphatase n=1 Tax=Hydrogenivirga caldilitoris TaxID=246264 RepID=A0A497XMH7_9AQUI|nr:inositol monophosphatase family protein [Hydrogenivirga caldilitoris]RLJ70028.1 myo-inositol-1(or 4)-monophosphatase [Hydrogenivirga caldilitoris]